MTARNLVSKLSLTAAALGAALAVPAPVLGDGVGEPAPAPVSAALPPVARTNEPAPCLGEETLGQVVAVSGDVQAVAPGAAPRALGCDAPLRCEELVTAPGASLSFVSGDVLVRVGGDARVALSGSAGALELFVLRGAVRTTDARAAGAAPLRLVARDLAASAAGADLALEAEAGFPSRLCAYDGRAAVELGARATTLAGAACLEAREDGPVRFAAAGPALGLEPPGFCAFEVAVVDHLTPLHVAAPDAFPFPGGTPAPDIARGPCDAPGSGCSAGRDFPFDDPDPVPGCDVPGVSCGASQD